MSTMLELIMVSSKNILLYLCSIIFTICPNYLMGGESPVTYMGLKFSFNFEYYAVALQLPESGRFDMPASNYLFRVFSSDTHKEIWRTEKVFGKLHDVYISDDGEYIAVVIKDHYINNNYLDDDHKKREIEQTKFLFFYKKDVLIKSYSVEELNLDMSSMYIGNRMFSVLPNSDFRLRFDTTLEDMRKFSNPYISGRNLRIWTYSRKELFFNIENGKLYNEVPDF